MLCLCRHIYWTDWGLGTIERASYDGTDRKVLVRGEEKWINGLALDLLGEESNGGRTRLETNILALMFVLEAKNLASVSSVRPRPRSLGLA